MNRSLSGSVACVALLSVAIAAEQRPAVPADAAIRKSTSLVNELYKDEFAKAQTPAQKTALAKKLVTVASGTVDDPAGCYVLLVEARQLAVSAGDLDYALSLVDSLGTSFDIDVLETKIETLVAAETVVKSTSQNLALTEHFLRLLNVALADDRFDQARTITRHAFDVAKETKNISLVSRVKKLTDKIEDAEKAFAEFKAAEKTLAASPDDQAANLSAGRYLCFQKDEWKRGLSMLALAGDSGLKGIAIQDLKQPADSKEQLQLADAWYEVSQSGIGAVAERHVLQRAGKWYQQAYAGLTGFTKLKVEKRLAEIGLPVVESRPTVVNAKNGIRPGETAELLPYVDLSQHIVDGKWTKSQTGTLVSDASENRSRIILPFVPTGDYRLDIKLTRKLGDEPAIVWLPVGDHHCLFILAGFPKDPINGFLRINDLWPRKNGTGSPFPVENNQTYHLQLTVRWKDKDKVLLSSTVDGRESSQWSGSPNALSGDNWLGDLPRADAIGIGRYKSVWVFEQVKLTMLTGQAKFLRDIAKSKSVND